MSDPKRILLVEDSPSDVELTLEALAVHQLANEVVVMGDGAEALDYLFRRGPYAARAADLPALVMLDLKLPRLSGHEVLRALRAEPATAHLPVVILTSSREESDLVQGYHEGANAYVVKPVHFHEFIEAVGRLGVFWALVNEPPKGSLPREAR
jgi:CheY-like chemotaxis protein